MSCESSRTSKLLGFDKVDVVDAPFHDMPYTPLTVSEYFRPQGSAEVSEQRGVEGCEGTAHSSIGDGVIDSQKLRYDGERSWMLRISSDGKSGS